MLKTVLTVSVFAAGMFAVPLSGETKSDFTGTWKLNEKARERNAPRNIVFKIEHKDPFFKYSATGGTAGGEKFTEATEFTTDGREHPGLHGGTVSGRWESGAVAVQYKIGGNKYSMTLRLSADGKQMFRDLLGHHEVYDKQ